MKPIVTVAYGGLSGLGRLPRWTTPFLVRLADRFQLSAANEGPPLRLVTRADGGLALVDPPDHQGRQRLRLFERPHLG